MADPADQERMLGCLRNLASESFDHFELARIVATVIKSIDSNDISIDKNAEHAFKTIINYASDNFTSTSNVETILSTNSPIDATLWTLCAGATCLLLPTEPCANSISCSDFEQALMVLYFPILSQPSLPPHSRQELITAISDIILRRGWWQLASNILQILQHVVTSSSSGNGSEMQRFQAATAALPLVSVLIPLASLVVTKAAAARKEDESAHLDSFLEFVCTSVFTESLRFVSEVGIGGMKQQKRKGKAAPQKVVVNKVAIAAALTKQLLPACLEAGVSLYGAENKGLQHLWDVITQLTSDDDKDNKACSNTSSIQSERYNTGMALLVQFIDPLVHRLQFPSTISSPTTTEVIVLRGVPSQPIFWKLLHQSLASLSVKEVSNSQRAVHALSFTIQAAEEQLFTNTEENKSVVSSWKDASNVHDLSQWRSFLLLYGIIEESSAHLFEQTWLDQISKLKDMPFEWTSIIWQQGLNHRHVSAQKVVAMTFLTTQDFDIKTTVSNTTTTKEENFPPVAFIVNQLLPVFGRVHMSRGDDGHAVRAAIPGFFQRYCQALYTTNQAFEELILGLVSSLVSKDPINHTLRFITTELLVQITSSIDESYTKRRQGINEKNTNEVVVVDASSCLTESFYCRFLTALSEAVQQQQRYGTSVLTVVVYKRLLEVANNITDAIQNSGLQIAMRGDIIVGVVRCLQGLPLVTIQPGGELFEAASQWVQQSVLTAGYSHNDNLIDIAPILERLEFLEDSSCIQGTARFAMMVSSSSSFEYTEEEEEEAELEEEQHKETLSVEKFLDELFGDYFVPLTVSYRCTTNEDSEEETEEEEEEVEDEESYVLPETEHLKPINALLEVCTFKTSTTAPTSAIVSWLARKLPPCVKKLCTLAHKNIEYWRDDIRIDHKNFSELNDIIVLPVDSIVRAIDFLTTSTITISITSRGGYTKDKTAIVTQLLDGLLELLGQCYNATLSIQHRMHGLSNSNAALNVILRATDIALRGIKKAYEYIGPDHFFGYMRIQNFHADTFPWLAETLVKYARSTPDDGDKESSSSNSARGFLDDIAWQRLGSWRALDSLLSCPDSLADRSHESDDWKIKVLVKAVVGINTPTKGKDHAVLPMLRCIRRLIPFLIKYIDHPDFSTVIYANLPRSDGYLKPRSTNKNSNMGSSNSFEAVDKLLTWMYDEKVFVTLWAQSRKNPGITAAVIATYLHPDLFNVEKHGFIESIHDPEIGVLGRFVRRLAQEAFRSNRLLLLFGIHFAGILAAYPEVASHYADVVAKLCVLGYDENDPDPVSGEIALDIESSRDMHDLLQPLNPELASAYKGTAVAPRVSMLCLLHSWVTRSLSSNSNASSNETDVEDIAACKQAAHATWSALLQLATTDPELIETKYFFKGPIHRKKVRVWQALTVLSPLIGSSTSSSTNNNNNNAIDTIIHCLTLSNAGSVKQYQEIVLLQLIRNSHNPAALLESHILPLIADYTQQRAEAVPSLAIVALHIGFELHQKLIDNNDPSSSSCSNQASSYTEWKKILMKIVTTVLPWCCSFVHSCRTFSQVTIWYILQRFPFLLEADLGIARFYEFLEVNSELKKARAVLLDDAIAIARSQRKGKDNSSTIGHDTMNNATMTEQEQNHHQGPSIDIYKLEMNTSPQGMLKESIALLGTADPTEHLEGAPVSLVDIVEMFLKRQRVVIRADMVREMKESGEVELLRGMNINDNSTNTTTTTGFTNSSTRSADMNGTTATKDFWQRKITPQQTTQPALDPWGLVLGLEALNNVDIERFETDILQYTVPYKSATTVTSSIVTSSTTTNSDSRDKNKHDLFVVASLIDRVPNLAGLARTCEIFGATLVLHDVSVLEDPQFTSISVSAENWCAIKQVKTDALSVWLTRMKQNGYTVVGLEQTADSVSLPEFEFPKKTVLVLGAERTGIPMDLLSVVEHSVEIPQWGVVRSLNVHVSGAIAIYSYVRCQQ